MRFADESHRERSLAMLHAVEDLRDKPGADAMSVVKLVDTFAYPIGLPLLQVLFMLEPRLGRFDSTFSLADQIPGLLVAQQSSRRRCSATPLKPAINEPPIAAIADAQCGRHGWHSRKLARAPVLQRASGLLPPLLEDRLHRIRCLPNPLLVLLFDQESVVLECCASNKEAQVSGVPKPDREFPR